MRNPAPPRARPTLAYLALLVLGYAAALALVYVLTVRTQTGRELADSSLRGAIRVWPLVSGTVERILDVVSVASLLTAVAVVAFIALLRLARVEGLVAVGILVGANITTWLLKNVLLPRPDLGLDEIAPPTLNSLPSGHATAAFSAVAALVVVVPRPWREITATAGAGYAAVTGVATMLAGWHRAADSVAAFLVVGAWVTVGAAALLAAREYDGGADEPGTTRSRPVRWLVRIAVVTTALGAALGAGLVLASLAPGNVVGSTVAFLAGCLFVVGASSGVTVAVLQVLRSVEADRRTP